MKTRTPDQVEIRIPRRAEFVRVARMAACALASQLDFTYDVIKDIELAVGEACANAVEHVAGEGSNDVTVRFNVDDGGANELGNRLDDGRLRFQNPGVTLQGAVQLRPLLRPERILMLQRGRHGGLGREPAARHAANQQPQDQASNRRSGCPRPKVEQTIRGH